MAAEWLLSLLDCSSHESSVQKSVSDTTKYTLHSFNFVSGTSALHQCQSLEIEPMTDVPQDSASRFLSACQQLEMFAGPIVDLRQSVTAYLGNYLPLVAFVVARERERERERETAIERHTGMQLRSTGSMDFRADSIPSPGHLMCRSLTLECGMYSSGTWEGPPIHAPQALLGRAPTSFSRS